LLLLLSVDFVISAGECNAIKCKSLLMLKGQQQRELFNGASKQWLQKWLHVAGGTSMSATAATAEAATT